LATAEALEGEWERSEALYGIAGALCESPEWVEYAVDLLERCSESAQDFACHKHPAIEHIVASDNIPKESRIVDRLCRCIDQTYSYDGDGLGTALCALSVKADATRRAALLESALACCKNQLDCQQFAKVLDPSRDAHIVDRIVGLGGGRSITMIAAFLSRPGDDEISFPAALRTRLLTAAIGAVEAMESRDDQRSALKELGDVFIEEADAALVSRAARICESIGDVSDLVMSALEIAKQCGPSVADQLAQLIQLCEALPDPYTRATELSRFIEHCVGVEREKVIESILEAIIQITRPVRRNNAISFLARHLSKHEDYAIALRALSLVETPTNWGGDPVPSLAAHLPVESDIELRRRLEAIAESRGCQAKFREVVIDRLIMVDEAEAISTARQYFSQYFSTLLPRELLVSLADLIGKLPELCLGTTSAAIMDIIFGLEVERNDNHCLHVIEGLINKLPEEAIGSELNRLDHLIVTLFRGTMKHACPVDAYTPPGVVFVCE